MNKGEKLAFILRNGGSLLPWDFLKTLDFDKPLTFLYSLIREYTIDKSLFRYKRGNRVYLKDQPTLLGTVLDVNYTYKKKIEDFKYFWAFAWIIWDFELENDINSIGFEVDYVNTSNIELYDSSTYLNVVDTYRIKETSMNTYNDDLRIVQKAETFAIFYHKNQMYGNNPYSYHLDKVCEVLVDFSHQNDDVLISAGWLHDVIEDTIVDYKLLHKEFGYEIADLVMSVTNESGIDRVSKFINTSLKIRYNRKALILKLADRIANVEASKENGSKYYEMYKNEMLLFSNLLYKEEHIELKPMWDRLFKATVFKVQG